MKYTDKAWKLELQNQIFSFWQLPESCLGNINKDTLKKLKEVTNRFPMAVTPYYLNLADFSNPDDPIAKMILPNPLELAKSPLAYCDPINEKRHSPLAGLIRRYPDRVVILASGSCAVNCRHCTRRHMGSGNIAPVNPDNMNPIVEYLRKNPEISDVIISGGDPLMLEDQVLKKIIKAVRDVSSVQIIRIGSRMPVTLPHRITKKLAKMLAQFQPVYFNTQFNHPKEITSKSIQAVKHLVDAGIAVSNQAVLLKGVNDDPEVILKLCRSLLNIRVRPYYFFLCDRWDSLGHFFVSVYKAVEIARYLRGRLSGLGIPAIVADLPGGQGKVPVNYNYVVHGGNGQTYLKSYDGQLIRYD